MGYDGKPWTGTGAGTYTNYDVNQPYGIFAVDREDGDKNAHARLLGSLAYIQPTDTYKASQAVYITELDSIEIKDTAAYIAPGTNTSVRPFGLYGSVGSTNLHASDITSFGQASSTIQTVWSPSNILSGAPPPPTLPARTSSTRPAERTSVTSTRTATSPVSPSGPGP